MKRKEFEEKFKPVFCNRIELADGAVYADNYEIWETHVALFCGGNYVGVLPLKIIKGIGG